jgi:hypothetical protein
MKQLALQGSCCIRTVTDHAAPTTATAGTVNRVSQLFVSIALIILPGFLNS